jgi:hypothetical protein
MRIGLLMFVIVAFAVGGAVAQPKHGDLILTVDDFGNNRTQNVVLVLDPKTGICTTLLGSCANHYLGTVRMAPNNTDVASPATQAPGWWPCHLWYVSPLGVVTTAASVPSGSIEGMALDHDDSWIAVGMNYTASPIRSECWSIGNRSALVNTLFSRSGWGFIDMSINRDPGASTYAIGYHTSLSTASTPKLFAANRNGIVRTIVQGVGNPLLSLTAFELDPTSGDYVVTQNQPAPSVSTVTDAGVQTTLATGMQMANSIRLARDRTFWVGAGLSTGSIGVYRLSPGGNTLTIIPISAFPASRYTITGIEIYGSRTLVCDKVSSSTVNVRVRSRHPWVQTGTGYALAASLARRPGIRLAGGDRLNLDTGSPLFFASALGLLPTVFKNFQGMLTLNPSNGLGTASATVTIPSAVQGLGIPVFVAGAIYNSGGVFEVTNTHWFLL